MNNPSAGLSGAGTADGLDAVTLDDYYDRAPCGYLSMAPDGHIVRVNQTFLDWIADSRESVLAGRRFGDLLSRGSQIYYETHCAPLLVIEGQVREIAFDLLCADGYRLPVLFGAEMRTAADGSPLIRATVFDATHRRSYERELLGSLDLERLAREEAEAELARLRQRPVQRGGDISGLPNRRWWQATLEGELRAARRSLEPLTIVLVEIDHFERYGQLHGHVAADRLLLQVSDVWRHAGQDLVARHDGEDFAAVLAGERLRETRFLVERLRRGTAAGTGFSVGIAQWDGRESRDGLVARAQEALREDQRRRGVAA